MGGVPLRRPALEFYAVQHKLWRPYREQGIDVAARLGRFLPRLGPSFGAAPFLRESVRWQRSFIRSRTMTKEEFALLRKRQRQTPRVKSRSSAIRTGLGPATGTIFRPCLIGGTYWRSAKAWVRTSAVRLLSGGLRLKAAPSLASRSKQECSGWPTDAGCDSVLCGD